MEHMYRFVLFVLNYIIDRPMRSLWCLILPIQSVLFKLSRVLLKRCRCHNTFNANKVCSIRKYILYATSITEIRPFENLDRILLNSFWANETFLQGNFMIKGLCYYIWVQVMVVNLNENWKKDIMKNLFRCVHSSCIIRSLKWARLKTPVGGPCRVPGLWRIKYQVAASISPVSVRLSACHLPGLKRQHQIKTSRSGSMKSDKYFGLS